MCVYVCVRVCIQYVCIFVCVVCECVHMCVYTCVGVCVCVCVCECVCACVRTYVRVKPNLWSSVYGDTESPLRRGKPSPSTSPWPDVHLPHFVTIRLCQSVSTSLFTLWVVVCQHYIACSDTSQIPSGVFI